VAETDVASAKHNSTGRDQFPAVPEMAIGITYGRRYVCRRATLGSTSAARLAGR
jgi:hypothetical protein